MTCAQSALLGLLIGFTALVPISAHAQEAPSEEPTADAPIEPADATPAETESVPSIAEPAPPVAEPDLTPKVELAPEDPVSAETEISVEEWKGDWILVQPKRTAVFEIDGYFRMRPNLLKRLDFGNDTATEFDPGTGEPLPRYPGGAQGKSNFSASDVRLRLDPTINVTDGVQVFGTIDVLDNVVLGSTPSTIPIAGGGTPVNALNNSQVEPVRGLNSIADSIAVKRLWARVTALNEQLVFKFGRMPNHWGLGMFSNSGDCLDCDFGQVADRVAVEFKLANHVIIPAFDWVSTGPVLVPFGRYAVVDGIEGDDAIQYSLQIIREDHPDDIRDMVRQGETVVNYGLWNILRTQDDDLDSTFYIDGFSPSGVTSTVENRNAFLYALDAYMRLYYGIFELRMEGLVQFGNFRDRVVDDTRIQENSVYQLGFASEAFWRFDGEGKGSTLSLKLGGASGDSQRGFGALDQSANQRGQSGTGADLKLNNFNFSPDYHVDLLLFRRIIGTVTDAWYVRPEFTYMFDDKLATKIAVMYAQAMFRRTTPGRALPLGLELDAEITYGLESNPDNSSFLGSLAAGVLFPFSGFDNLALNDDDQGGSFAWTLQARLYVVF